MNFNLPVSKTFSLVIAFALGAVQVCGTPARPNVLVVLTDDQGYAQLDPFITGSAVTSEADPTISPHFAGPQSKIAEAAKAAMPHLAQLAREGIRFSDATVPIPVCSPSRAAFITGRYPQRFGVYSNDDIVASGMAESEIYLSEIFQRNGYATAIIGKWHLGKYVRQRLDTDSVDYHRQNRVSMREEDHPLNRGFDRYFGFTASGSNFYNPSSLFDGWNPVVENDYLTDAFTREAIAFIENRPAHTPFFLFLSYNAPHIPVYEPAPEAYREAFDSGNPAVDNYYAKLRAVDAGIGRIRDLLSQRGEWDDTFVVYFSDNGAVADSPHPRNAPFSGFKGRLQQGGVRVPMVWKMPAGASTGSVVHTPVSSMDILPTALALAGLDANLRSPLDGVDLRPFIGESASSMMPHEFLFFAGSNAAHWSIENLSFWQNYQDYLDAADLALEHPASTSVERFGPGGLAVRHGDWWLRWNPAEQRFQLYNLSLDPAELSDLAAAHQDQHQLLLDALRVWICDLPQPTDWEPRFWRAMRSAVGCRR